MGIRKELLKEGTKIEIGGEGVIIGQVRVGEEKWRIIGMYVGREYKSPYRDGFRRMDGG